jgi:hypothetical protein
MAASRYVVLVCAGIALISEAGCQSSYPTLRHVKTLTVQPARPDGPVLSVENVGGRIPQPGLSLAVWADGFVVHSVANAAEATNANYRVGFASNREMKIIIDLARAIFTYPERDGAIVGIGIAHEITTLYSTSGPEVRCSDIRPGASVLVDYVRSLSLRDAKRSACQPPLPTTTNWESIRKMFEADRRTD